MKAELLWLNKPEALITRTDSPHTGRILGLLGLMFKSAILQHLSYSSEKFNQNNFDFC